MRRSPDGPRALTDSERERVSANLGLVGLIAKRLGRRSRLPFSERFQVGCFGLILAAQRFDPDRGHFASYACAAIRWAILAELSASGGSLRLPIYLSRPSAPESPATTPP